MLVTMSDLNNNSPTVIDYFWDLLSIPLQWKILNLENPPKTFKDWYDWAQKIDNFRRMQCILGRGNNKKPVGNDKKKEERPGQWWIIPRRDPNAMDIDTMTTEQWDEAMRKGLCFGCGKQGHLSRDCLTKKKPTTANSTPPSYALTWAPASMSTQKKKMNGKELHTHIQSLTAMMDEEEKEKFYDEAEKEGFWLGESPQRQFLQHSIFTW